MRFRLTLHNPSSATPMAYNYNYLLMSWIYIRLQLADENYSKWLHQEGYQDKLTGKRFKYFTYSPFFYDGGRNNYTALKGSELMTIHAKTLYLDLSFYIDAAAEKFIVGVFRDQKLELFNDRFRAEFTITQISTLPEPKFEETMEYKALSPMCIMDMSKNRDRELSPIDPKFAELFALNLQSKYEIYANEKVAIKDIDFQLSTDAKYLKSKLWTIKEKSKAESTIKGYENFSFKLTAPVEVQKIAYFGGFGRYCSDGMGFCELKQ
jgi:CRISPR-associated endoribonuclease Cas6